MTDAGTDMDRIIENEKGRETEALSFFVRLDLFLRHDIFIAEVCACISACGVKGYLVGGLLRDLALNRGSAKDYDFVVSGMAEAVAGLAAGRLGGSFFLFDRLSGAYRAVIKTGAAVVTLDFSPMRGALVEDDLMARDFTVNAMAADLSAFSEGRAVVIDPSNGLVDASASVLRAVSEGAFVEDPLRCVRAVRLSHCCGLEIEPATMVLVRASAGLLKGTAAERIREELILIFGCSSGSKAISRLYELGIMDVIAPVLSGWKDIGGYDLLGHSLATLNEADRLLDEFSAGTFISHHEELRAFMSRRIGPIGMDVFFRVCAFLHDIGKPLAIDRESGRLRFIGHDSAGAALAKELLLSLRFSKAFSTAVSGVIKNHHRVFMLFLLPERSARVRAHFFRASGGSSGVTLLLLALADARATSGRRDLALEALVSEMIGFYYSVYLKKKPRPILTGDEIMRIFSLAEGKAVGEALRAVSMGVEEGAIKTRKDALSYLGRWLQGQSG